MARPSPTSLARAIKQPPPKTGPEKVAVIVTELAYYNNRRVRPFAKDGSPTKMIYTFSEKELKDKREPDPTKEGATRPKLPRWCVRVDEYQSPTPESEAGEDGEAEPYVALSAMARAEQAIGS